VELYNDGDEEVDISDWSVVPLSDPSKEEVVLLTNLSPKSFYVLGPEDGWLNTIEDTLILEDGSGAEVDRTPALFDLQDSDCAWGRYPDGSADWLFMESSMGKPNSGKLCEEEEVDIQHIKFSMDKKVSGSGFVSIRNSISAGDSQNIRSQEHGSGRYESEEAARYSADLSRGSHEITLNKSDLSARYGGSEQNVTPGRSVRYDSRWSESSQAWGSRDSSYIAESTRYATTMDSEIDLKSSNYRQTSRMGSKFEGKARIESGQGSLRSSEEYTGSFEVLGNILEKDYSTLESSVRGEGFVDVSREIGGALKTYQRGTGSYRAEEQIDIGKRSVNKEIDLAYSPASYSYFGGEPINRSLLWSEGTRSGECGASFVSTDFSNIRRLEAETKVISAGDIRMEANFSGRVRMQEAFKNPSGNELGRVYIDDEYSGDYSITRKILIRPVYKAPHLTVYSQGLIHRPECDRLEYTITIVNDGNQVLGPIYLRDTFPSGTSFMGSSIEPFELAPRYGNWSIPTLGSGGTISFDLYLQITARRENYTNRLSAVTIYKQTTGKTTRDRRLRASNSSLLEADWSNCPAQDISATLTASVDPKDPRILNYRLAVQNLADENMSINATVLLPQGLKFINSTLKPSGISEDKIVWTISKLVPERRRSISFVAEAEREGLLVSRARVVGSTIEGREIASLDISAPILLGKPVAIMPRLYSPDWLPCEEEMLGPNSWNEAMISSGEALECAC
jgi:uncharacterized repeat protein (TIGR01451 family)